MRKLQSVTPVKAAGSRALPLRRSQVFTSCLPTPIEKAWLVYENHQPHWSHSCAISQLLCSLALQQQLHDLGDDCFCALIELRVTEIRDRVRHLEETKLGKAPGLGHSAARRPERLRDD